MGEVSSASEVILGQRSISIEGLEFAMLAGPRKFDDYLHEFRLRDRL
jgi:hypothetical protein